MRRSILAVALALLFTLSSSAAEPDRLQLRKSTSVEIDDPSIPSSRFSVAREPGRIIIELDARPLLERDSKRRTVAAAELNQLLDQLEKDLAAIDGGLPPTTGIRSLNAPVVRHRYTLAFAGASAVVRPEAVSRIRDLDYVRRVHPDRVSTALLKDSIVQIGAPDVWRDYGLRGEGALVAVIDTGIDYTHPALGGGFGPGHKVEGGRDFVNGDDDPMDDSGHGTHVAGIIAADGGGLLGVAPDAHLLAYKVLDQTGGGLDSAVLAAVESAVEDGAHIVNMSLGRQAVPDDPVVRAVETASAAGVLFCVAAGNTGRFLDIGSPANAPSALTVGAADQNGEIARFSSKGPLVPSGAIKPEVAAPGVAIVSAAPGGGTRTASGTSMAAPHVAGVAALLRSIHPDWPAKRIRTAIIAGATPLDAEVIAAGAGRIYAPASVDPDAFPSPSTLSFGVVSGTEGVSTMTKSLYLTNHSSQTKSVSIAVDPAGEAIRLVPDQSSVEIAPNEAVAVSLELEVDHSAVPAPAEGSLSFGGLIRVSGEHSTQSIPWSFVKATSIALTWEGSREATVMIGTENMVTEGWTTPEKPTVKLFIGAGEVSLWVMGGGLYAPVVHHVIIDNPDLSGTDPLVIGPDDAPHRIRFEGRDLFGIRLSDRGTRAIREIAFLHPRFGRRLLDAFTYVWPDQEVWVSDLSEDTQIVGFERAFDLDESTRTWMALYPVVRGVHQDITFDLDPEDWTFLPLHAVIPSDLERPYLTVGATGWISFAGQVVVSVGQPVLGDPGQDPPTFAEGYLSAAPASQAGASIRIEAGERPYFEGIEDPQPSPDLIAEFSGVEGGSAPGQRLEPRLGDRVVPSGEAITIGEGPVHPFSWVAVRDDSLTATVTWFGPVREQRPYDAKRTRASLYDAGGGQVAAGEAPPRYSPGFGPPFILVSELPEPGRYTLEAVNDSFDVAGIPSEATLRSSFDTTGSDATPATLTSLRVSDGSSATSASLPKGSAAALTFSVLDLDEGEFSTPGVAVDWRPHRDGGGTAPVWTTLSAIEIGNDLESPPDIEGIPAGILFRVDLSSVTSAFTGPADLRISIGDSGETTTYVLEPAFVVRPSRGRPVVHR